MISDILFDTNETLLSGSRHYASGDFDYDPEVFDEIKNISARLEQLKTKLDSPSFKGSWRFNPDFRE